MLFSAAEELQLEVELNTRSAAILHRPELMRRMGRSWAESILREYGVDIARNVRAAVAAVGDTAHERVVVRVCTLTVPVDGLPAFVEPAVHADTDMTRHEGVSVGVLIQSAGALEALSARIGAHFVARVSHPRSAPVTVRRGNVWYARCEVDLEVAFLPPSRTLPLSASEAESGDAPSALYAAPCTAAAHCCCCSRVTRD